MAQIARSFFTRPTVTVARALLGQSLVHIDSGQRLVGMIVETEAYVGQTDLACHARAGRTKRTEVMFGSPGHAYVYFTYGVHWMLNCVTEQAGFPAAVLLRAIVPQEGVAIMRKRRQQPDEQLVNGPAKLAQALGIDKRYNGYDLCHSEAALYIEQAEIPSGMKIVSGPRIGLGKTPEPWKSVPWNFRLVAK